MSSRLQVGDRACAPSRSGRYTVDKRDIPMTSSDSAAASRHALRAGALSVPALVFLVMAFQSPLTSAAGNGPIVIAGNGIGAPGTFILCGNILSLFAVPYAAMSRRITYSAAFYKYV